MKNHSQNFQPEVPTYFLIAWETQLSLMNTSGFHPLNKDGTIPPEQPRFMSGTYGDTVRHMIACIDCSFVQRPANGVDRCYAISKSNKWWVIFEKVTPDSVIDLIHKVYYLKNEKTGKIFAILNKG